MELKEALTAIRVHARQMEAYQVIAATLDDVAKIDAMRSEASQLVEAERKNIEAAKGELAAVNAEIAEAKKRLQQDETQGQAIIELANREAKDIEARAKRDAEAVKAAANNDADRVGSLVVNAQRQLETLNDQIAKAAGDVKAREGELAALEGKIAAAKEQIAKLLGA